MPKLSSMFYTEQYPSKNEHCLKPRLNSAEYLGYDQPLDVHLKHCFIGPMYSLVLPEYESEEMSQH